MAGVGSKYTSITDRIRIVFSMLTAHLKSSATHGWYHYTCGRARDSPSSGDQCRRAGEQLTVKTTDGKVLHLKAGNPIVEVVNTLHYGINEGTVPAEIVVFYAGIVGQSLSVSEQR